jgi:hypothetical protein
MMPKTKIGRWAGALSALFVVLLVAVLNRRNLWGVRRIGDPLTIMVTISMMISGIAAFVTGTISLIKFKDRSFVVIVATILGFIAVLLVIMEVVEGIIERSTH